MSSADLSTLIVEFVGWTVFHSIWLGLLVTLLSEFTFWIGRRWSANTRYLLGMIFLAIFVLAPIVTTIVRTNQVLEGPPKLNWILPNPLAPQVHDLSMYMPKYATQSTPYRGWRMQVASAVAPLIPYVVGSWMICGIALGGLRAWMIFVMHREIFRISHEIESIRGRVSVLRLELGVRKKVLAVSSDLVNSPATLGFFKPLILLPASMVTSLTPAELDLILMHELAHIRRHDYLVNLIQVGVEHVYFYHPGMWRLSKRIRVERENCCDDMAVQMSGAPLEYARALTSLETIRMRAPVLAQPMAGTVLKSRVLRIVKPQPNQMGLGGMAFPCLVVLIALALTSLGAITVNKSADQMRDYKKLKNSTYAELIYDELGCGKTIDDERALASLAETYVYCRQLSRKEIDRIPAEQLDRFARAWITHSGPNTYRQKLVAVMRPESFEKLGRQSDSQPWLAHDTFKLVKQLWLRAQEVRKTDPTHGRDLALAAVLLVTQRSATLIPLSANRWVCDPVALEVLQVDQPTQMRLLRVAFFFSGLLETNIRELEEVNKLLRSLDDSGAPLSDDDARIISTQISKFLFAGENREETRWLGAMAIRHLRIRFAGSQPAQWKIIERLLDDPSMAPIVKSWCQPLSPEAQAVEDNHGFVQILKQDRYWLKMDSGR